MGMHSRLENNCGAWRETNAYPFNPTPCPYHKQNSGKYTKSVSVVLNGKTKTSVINTGLVFLNKDIS
jgi:hypothetical protein